MSTPIEPNALTRPQVARVVGVSQQAVEQRIVVGALESFEYFGTVMVPMRAVRKWERERAKRQARQAVAALGGS